jgi:hypothetical protein
MDKKPVLLKIIDSHRLLIVWWCYCCVCDFYRYKWLERIEAKYAMTLALALMYIVVVVVALQ